MANKYYSARDDGETWGPFPDGDEAILHSIMQLAEDPDGQNPIQMQAVDLMAWHGRMVTLGRTHSDVEYGSGLTASKDLIQRCDWIIYGVEFVVDSPSGQPQGVANFLWSADLIHNPNEPNA